MRGDDQQQSGMFSYVSLEERVPQDHPLRAIRKSVDEVLRAMAKDFDGMYAKTGRPSVPPERLLRAVLLQIFYTVRSERMLMEQMNYNLLFRWFVGLELDEPVWNHAVFSKNRDRLLNQEVAREFFSRVLAQAKPHLSEEHFSVDGTLIRSEEHTSELQSLPTRRSSDLESGSLAEPGGCAGVLLAGAGAGQAASVGRALQRGRHADRGLGQPEELPEERWRGWRRRSVSRRAAQE